MDSEAPYIGSDCLIHIFTFLNVEDLINVSSVCKDWLEAAQTPWLWRRVCLQCWGFCNMAVVDSEHMRDAWKRYYLRRSHLESNMTQGRSGCDYTCKSLRAHTGRVVGLVYLEKNTPTATEPWNFRSTICSASTDGTVRAWDVKNGVELWRSAVQSPLTSIVSDREHGLVITSDSSGLIKSWQAQTGVEVASYPTASPYCTLLPYTIKDSCFLFVGTTQGSLQTLSGPEWSKTSSVVVCDSFNVNLLLASPDKKWILAGTKENHDLSPKLISAASLINPSAEEDPLSQCLPVPGFHTAVFMPTHPARLAVIHQGELSGPGVLTVLDVSMKTSRYKSEIQVVQHGSSSRLLLDKSPHNFLLEAKDDNTLVMADHQELWIYSLKFKSQSSMFKFPADVSSISVDRFRVVAACRDLSLRVYIWTKDGDQDPGRHALKSRYHLLGGSHTMSRGFSHVACDYSSIVAVAEGNNGKDVLKVYSFTS